MTPHGCAVSHVPMNEPSSLLRPEEYPRSSTYDPQWVIGLDMGPHPLWLLEDLSAGLDIRPGMRILDLGSGKGATSVFLAKEFGAEVWAADLWVDPDEAARTFREAGVSDRVHALRAEAHTLPFARETFDAIVSIDAFEYFGTSDTYIGYLAGFLKPGGQIGIATPALTREVRELGAIPSHIHAVVGAEALAWHTAEWWRFQWEMSERLTEVEARLQESGWRDWLLWSRVVDAHGNAPGSSRAVVEMLEADAGEYLSFAMVTARRAADR